ncbi:MAG: hypothetical protein IPO27_13110 [Bacteroidetes bacterium]|nr:hypothetical protein [Bacteroidota bacterium]
MDILIDKSKKLIEIQAEFQKRFPFLKIEFYKKGHAQGEGSTKNSTLNTEQTIGEVGGSNVTEVFKVHGLMTVAELENAFGQTFRLSAQVFRKSGTLWLQTTATDSWTLAEQNKEGMEKTASNGEDRIDAMDLHDLE